VNRRDLALWGAGLLLLAIAIVRLAVPDRSRLRPLSMQGFDVQSERIEQGQTLTRESRWEPPVDVFVMGWVPRLGAPGSGATVQLLDGETRLFEYVDGHLALNQTVFPAGTGYLLRKGRALLFRYRITNTGPPAETRGASALVYYVPVEGN
jgi:hypothetical protein